MKKRWKRRAHDEPNEPIEMMQQKLLEYSFYCSWEDEQNRPTNFVIRKNGYSMRDI